MNDDNTLSTIEYCRFSNILEHCMYCIGSAILPPKLLIISANFKNNTNTAVNVEHCNVTLNNVTFYNNVMPYYPPPGQCWGIGGDLNFAKFKCTTHWARQSVKSQPSPHSIIEENMGNLIVGAFIVAHAYDKRSNSPHMGQVLVSKQVKFPTFPPIWPWWGVVGHNIDRCINVNSGYINDGGAVRFNFIMVPST